MVFLKPPIKIYLKFYFLLNSEKDDFYANVLFSSDSVFPSPYNHNIEYCMCW